MYMAAIHGTPVGQRISSHPVNGFRFLNETSQKANAEELEHKAHQPKADRKIEIAAVAGALITGFVLVTAAATIFGKVLLGGLQFAVGL